jgi:hypothetical protein
MRKYFFLFLILYNFQSFGADTSCIILEGISIGCVPSTDHMCNLNKNPENDGIKAGTCHYFPKGAFDPPPASDPYFDTITSAGAGPIKFNCQTAAPGAACGGGEVGNCPDGECAIYFQPTCSEGCTWCIKDEKTEQGLAKGCINCTRGYCPDEPQPTVSCPSNPIGSDGKPDLNYLIPDQKYPRCSANNACPRALRAPGGKPCVDTQGNLQMTADGLCIVNVPPSDCQPRQQLKRLNGGIVGESCPWKIDNRTAGTLSTSDPGLCEKIHCNNCFSDKCKQDCVP